eukprot:gnl/MRDRNA2_/MRDRNA2_146433_c0_seq1.p1 gnl/MRDRNA2_/MRDRNA2_146433_c0~~gnl/MRDRNA2_/MRDRNA2_146433_c0_seq1.p1  ORF type:complete len:233 (-),score=51.26 gnl/MRDRNA2_/MRDRNA2_146433_c0_seq1:99-797(-)
MAEDSRHLEVFVNAALTGEWLATVKVTSDQTVRQFRHVVQESTGIQTHLDFIVDGNVLEDSKVIADCGINDKAAVQALRKCVTFSLETSKDCIWDCFLLRYDYSVRIAPGDYADLEVAQSTKKAQGDGEKDILQVGELREVDKQEILDLLRSNDAMPKDDSDDKFAEAEQLWVLLSSVNTAVGFDCKHESHHRMPNELKFILEHEFLVAGHLLSLHTVEHKEWSIVADDAWT